MGNGYRAAKLVGRGGEAGVGGGRVGVEVVVVVVVVNHTAQQ